MTAKFGGSINTNDTATSTATVLNDTTAVTILAAQDLTVEQPRIRVAIINESSQDVWIRPHPASFLPTVKIGFKILKKSSVEIMAAPNVYTGEWSALADIDNPTIITVSY